MTKQSGFTSHRFPWGKVIDRLFWKFDGLTLEIVKFHPWKGSSGPAPRDVDDSVTHYCCEGGIGIYESFDAALIGWIAHRRVGANSYGLAAGVCRALRIEPTSGTESAP